MRLPNWRSLSQPLAIIEPYTPVLLTALRWTLMVLCPLVLFASFFNPNVINPTRIGWLMQADWGQHVLGWNAFRHVDWSSFNHEDLLGAPVGLSVVYTDSNPLFAFFFKPFRHLLPDNFQYIGMWFFICVCLHFTFAYKLIKPHAPNKWAALGGALALSALPCLYYRMRHDTLMAQWLILWALHLFINVDDGKAQVATAAEIKAKSLIRKIAYVLDPKVRGYAVLLGLTGLIHPYLLFMVAAIWGGDVWRRLVPAVKTKHKVALVDIVLGAGFVIVWPLLTLGISGAYAQGQSPGAGGWSYYSMGLDALFNPVRPEFSAILKAWPQDAGQSFEGYQYLGFGLLVLLATAIVLYIMTPEAKAARGFVARLKPLTLPFIALFLIAITNHVQIYGYTVLRFALPDEFRNTLSVLRASGRFFWPISYCLVLTALVVLFKTKPRVIAILLPAVLLIQVYDLWGFAAAMRDATRQAADPKVYVLTPSPTWDKLVTASKGIDFYPPNVHFNDKLFYELTWRATSHKLPVNTMYAARENVIQLANEQVGQDAFLHGQVNNDRLFVFLKQCDAPSELQPRLRMLDGVWIIPPSSAQDVDLPKPQWNPIRADIRFGWLDQGVCLLDDNWSKPENTGVWSRGPQADVMIPFKHVQFDTPNPTALDLNLKAQSHRPVLVTVLINNAKVAKLSVTPTQSVYTIHVPARALSRESMKLRFLVERDTSADGGKPDAPDPVVPPSVLGRSAQANATPPLTASAIDKKYNEALGIKLFDIQLIAPKPPAPPPIVPYPSIPAALPLTGLKLAAG